MKENKYDEAAFFEKYSRFPRSVEGLSAAGEWETLRRMLPGFEGRRVLDLGCGFGWHCRYAAEGGAAYVLGTDISEKMLGVAREKNGHDNVEYRRMAMEDMDFEPESFDVVLSSLAIHYVEDMAGLCGAVYRALVPGGVFVYSAEHPVFTAYGDQQWRCDAQGNKLHWPVDRYFEEGWRDAGFLGEQVRKHHKTLERHISCLLQAGFTITGLSEPKPGEEMLRAVDGMEDELRRPMMLIISAQKPA